MMFSLIIVIEVPGWMNGHCKREWIRKMLSLDFFILNRLPTG